VHGFEFEPGTSGHVISLSSDMYRQLARHEPQVSSLFVGPQLLELRREELRAADLVGSVRVLAREFARVGMGHELALDGWLRVMLGNVLRLARELPDPRDPAVGQRRLLLERFIELVERRFASGQTVGKYAAALKVSSWQLRRACLDLAGQSPVQLIHARLLLEAKRLLHYSELAAQEIAGRLGFKDAAYFSRFFSRHVGMSPRAFRRDGPEESPRRPRAPE
jgi:AraC family transcriptional activator of pobA